MSQQALKPLPIRIDPVNFADHARKLEGLVATKGMKRLLANVQSVDSMIVAKLNISPGFLGYPLVLGQVFAAVAMRCERCLDEVNTELNLDIEVLVKSQDHEMPEKEQIQDEDELEFYEYEGKSLVLSDFIEEELLLELPLVPKHQDILLCNQDMIAWLAANEAPSKEQATSNGKAESPFAILKR
ncbi:MAG: YceD family protein [Gammaproteobacteria bacterium]